MDIIERFKIANNNEYEYSNVKFINQSTKVSVTCKIHGDWLITPKNHLKGRGCPKCGLLKISKCKSKSFEEFINKAKIIHDNKYQYEDNANYKNLNSIVNIKCLKCDNIFSIKAKSHLNDKTGCPICSKEKRAKLLRETYEKFVTKSKEKHGDIYEYNENDYISLSHDTIIKCKKCNNIFKSNARSHVLGNSKCRICYPLTDVNKIGHDEFVKRSVELHGDCYDYSIEKVDIMLQHINIKCKKCNTIFSILPHSHIRNLYSCCRICNPKIISQEEKQLVSFIKTELSETDNISIIENTKDIIHPKELDIYIPEKNLAIEYNGLFWHCEKKLKNHKSHYKKYKMCQGKGIKLIQFFSDEWRDKEEICKSMIRYKIGKIKTILAARKCIIKEISNKDAREFYNTNHISGGVDSKYNIGLFYNEELVSCLSLRKPFTKSKDISRNNTIEISRFCNKINTTVNGSFSKMLKYFILNMNNGQYENILTYADLRFGDGNIYLNNGFILKGYTGVDYWYTDNILRYNRFKYKANNGKPEKQVAKENNVNKIYGCGSNIYILKL